MITNIQPIYSRIKQYEFNVDDNSIFEQRILNLEKAINESVKEISEQFKNEVHIGFSGGVDSALILSKIVQYGFPVIAHTMGNTKNHPDIVHAQKYVHYLQNGGANITHTLHITSFNQKDIESSNSVLKTDSTRPDNYFMIMKELKSHAPQIICCDVIDELMGGYYAHQNPQNLPIFNPNKSHEENRLSALQFLLEKLIPNHLSVLDKFSDYFEIPVFLPYASQAIFDNCNFGVNELVDETQRKKPIYQLAEKNEVISPILKRKKLGLVDALSY